MSSGVINKEEAAKLVNNKITNKLVETIKTIVNLGNRKKNARRRKKARR